MTRLEPSDVEAAVRSLIRAERTNLGIEISVPVAYGDGDLATVVVEANAEGYDVHDAGFSAMRLSASGLALSKGVSVRLNEYCARYQCTFSAGRVFSRADVGNLALVVCLVANASRSVADYAYEIRRQSESDFRTIVFDALRELFGKRARNSEEFVGESGRRYRLPIVLDVMQLQPQNFVATIAHRNTVSQSYAMFSDLKGSFPYVEQDAVYDETADIRDEDRKFIASTGAAIFTLPEAQMRLKRIPDAHAQLQ